jgi:hypothetical protein
MSDNFYTYALADRRRMLADSGFTRDELRIWSHPNGQSIGEGVAAALTDVAFLRFLKSGTPPTFGAEAEDAGAEPAIKNHLVN